MIVIVKSATNKTAAAICKAGALNDLVRGAMRGKTGNIFGFYGGVIVIREHDMYYLLRVRNTSQHEAQTGKGFEVEREEHPRHKKEQAAHGATPASRGRTRPATARRPQ